MYLDEALVRFQGDKEEEFRTVLPSLVNSYSGYRMERWTAVVISARDVFGIQRFKVVLWSKSALTNTLQKEPRCILVVMSRHILPFSNCLCTDSGRSSVCLIMFKLTPYSSRKSLQERLESVTPEMSRQHTHAQIVLSTGNFINAETSSSWLLKFSIENADAETRLTFSCRQTSLSIYIYPR